MTLSPKSCCSIRGRPRPRLGPSLVGLPLIQDSSTSSATAVTATEEETDEHGTERNLGGTVGSSILGAVLANRLPDYLKTRIGELHLPPQALQHLPSGGANAILQPGALSQLPPAVATAIRLALSDTLRDIYKFAGLILIAALVATVFLKEVPLTGTPTQAFGEPVPEDDDTKAREAVAV